MEDNLRKIYFVHDPYIVCDLGFKVQRKEMGGEWTKERTP